MIKQKTKEKIILGLDPGTNIMGYGIIEVLRDQVKLIQYGVIQLNKYESHELRLKKIFERVTGIIDDYKPDHVALEAPFYGKNIQVMLKLGRAQGVAMAAALSREIPITDYAPRKVKQSVTGNGNASKEQVSAMLQRLLSFKHDEKLLDATDALAVALCHHFQRGVPTKKNYSNWKSFISENPDRMK
ncbi:MAG TPA: crossover junction endodeoxyribonuclease RuvC [Cyclobacteriaceae bacterium]